MELINDGGWHGARLPELRGDIYQKLRDLLGDINPDGDSLIGQVMAVVAENDLNIVEAIGWTFAGFFISSGEGIQLDGIGEGFTASSLWLNTFICRCGLPSGFRAGNRVW